jgi:hypothetical protein
MSEAPKYELSGDTGDQGRAELTDERVAWVACSKAVGFVAAPKKFGHWRWQKRIGWSAYRRGAGIL